MIKNAVPILYIICQSVWLYFGEYYSSFWGTFFYVSQYGMALFFAFSPRNKDTFNKILKETIAGIWIFYIFYNCYLSRLDYAEVIENNKSIKTSLVIGSGIIVMLFIELVKYKLKYGLDKTKN